MDNGFNTAILLLTIYIHPSGKFNKLCRPLGRSILISAGPWCWTVNSVGSGQTLPVLERTAVQVKAGAVGQRGETELTPLPIAALQPIRVKLMAKGCM